ncbi:MAG TPA: ribonuclease III domain-containing protein [Methanospirillum sp.]|nr:ribonuclease III domain-containing protein [Methanospirillum sp.]
MVKNQSGPDIEQVTGYEFTQPSLLTRALTRRAYAMEKGVSTDLHMDAYATLGDAVIELVILTGIISSGESDKGDVSAKKMDMVNMTVLRQAAERCDLQSYILWGKGEERMHVWTSGRVLAECMEALIGAVYLDGGLSAAAGVMDHLGLSAGLVNIP